MKPYLSWFTLQKQRLAEQGLRRRLKALVRKCLAALVRPVARFLEHHPRARQRVVRVLDLLGLRLWIKRIQAPSTPARKIVLSPRAKVIRRDLERALAEHRES